jgi:hypothetical protein
MVILDIVGGLFDIGKGLLEGNKVKNEKKLELDIKKMEAQAELDIANQKATTDYDIEALKQSSSSWKDEYLTILLSLPLIGSFIPVVQDYVVNGWGYISLAPHWYQASFIGVIAATFGLRWLFSKYKTTDNA